MFKKLFQACQGRHTALVLGFFFSGNFMHWFHRLDATYISYMIALMSFVLGHSIKEDWFNSNNLSNFGATSNPNNPSNLNNPNNFINPNNPNNFNNPGGQQ